MPKKPEKEEKPKSLERTAIISAVKTYLGFFVLIALIVEAALVGIALNVQAENQAYVIFGMLFVIVALIAVVSLFAAFKPDVLLRRIGSPSTPEIKKLYDFCARVSGSWWEKITPAKSSALSFVELRADAATNSIKMKGKAYDGNGKLAAYWESVASCINPNERIMFYHWKGWHPARPNDPYEGFGEISFHESAKRFESGAGTFFDSNIKDMKSTTRKSVEFRRCTDTDIRVIQEGNEKEISDIVLNRL